MSIEQQVIIDELKAEGINEALATGLNFETTEDLSSWVENFKTAMPTVKPIEQYTREEIEELSKDPEFKGAKGLKGFYDSVRTKAAMSSKKTETPNQKPTDPPKFEIPEEIKTQLEQMKILNEKVAKSDFEALVKSKANSAQLDEDATKQILKILKVGDDEAAIDAEIKTMKDILIKLGVKAMGTPGGGSNAAKDAISKAAKEWAEKEKLKKQKFNNKK